MQRRSLLLGSLLFISGSAIFYMFPPYLAQIGARLSLNVEQLGMLAAAESLGLGLASLSAPLWSTRVNRRLFTVLGVLVCIVGNVATARAGSYHAVLLSRVVVGLLGEGVLLTLSYGVLALRREVDKGFAIALTAAVSFGAAVIAAAGTLEKISAAFGTLLPLIAVSIACLPFLGWFPKVPEAAAVGATGTPTRHRYAAVIVALVAQAVWFGAPGAFWTFAEQVATDRGFATGPTELALSVGELASLVGSLLAAAMGERGGRLRLIFVSTLGIVTTAAVYAYCTTAVALAVVLSVFYILWNFGTVYQLGLVSSLDTSGRLSVLMPAAQVFGLSVGPLVAGRWMQASGDFALVMTTAAFAGVAMLLYAVPLLLRIRDKGSSLDVQVG